MHKNLLTAATLAALTTAGMASAATFVLFDGDDAVVDPDANSFSLTEGSITATLSIVGPDAVNDEFNGAGTGFGINAAASGDETQQIDGGAGAESFDISFNVPVFFNGGTVSLTTTSDSFSVTLPDTSVTVEDGSDSFAFTTDNVVDPGEAVRIAWIEGNGFSFDSFTVTVIPEPMAAGATGLLGLVGLRRRRA
ncbi:MAG: hypothetical protein AAF561_04510 [Planctomycetota bacterium]